jgi:hypothetical protein
LNALFDACERCNSEENSKKDAFLRAADSVSKSFIKNFPFPYANSYKRFLRARYEFLNKQERTGRRHMLKAARDALSTKMPFVQAISLYQYACHQTGAKRDQNMDLAKMLLSQHKVKIYRHSHFKALWDERESAFENEEKLEELVPENVNLDQILEDELEQEAAASIRPSLGLRSSTSSRLSGLTVKKPLHIFKSRPTITIDAEKKDNSEGIVRKTSTL